MIYNTLSKISIKQSVLLNNSSSSSSFSTVQQQNQQQSNNSITRFMRPAWAFGYI
ncbi:hypothetical protein DFA_06714 [Cavenderia fasciculata]|uniref:Uncharacterized protein n=1 Tax=Cavenderia fasciculata TaxID=261658 RepID=F4Q227_CACFS|nr:uncharacterized protein DFA_06714 [Cavenderia fasciculata]EGG18047.1 hypothetical protein DFA_06714 [Cavenderia fasciculata]|eukprot:XP_004356940.1 hypothetical protein DFA_06714 [Cavenderia fasciculata]